MSKMTIDEIKASVAHEIDRRSDDLIDIAKHILANPEPGFREQKTSKYVGEQFEKLNIPFESGIGLTGLKGILDGGNSGPTVGVFGELDSLIVLGHPYADPVTNAAHACGHHAQIGNMLAVAVGLQAPGVLENLSGRVALLAVPAEEYIEIEYRDDLRVEGKLEFLGGKPEFIKDGAMDDVDIAMMTHTENRDWAYDGKIGVGATNNGMVAKRIQFLGVASHAGGSPHLGTNALNAANIALMGIHAQRETFRDHDTIRVHPIITQGGIAVSSVPADVRMETFVRGRTIDAYTSAAKKVDRALRAGAMAVGGRVKITTVSGYTPIQQDPLLTSIYEMNATPLVGDGNVVQMGHRSGSTDMGDISQLMPAIHPYAAGAIGKAHGDDYVVADYELAITTAGKAMAHTIIDLLSENGNRANEIISRFTPPMTKNQYLAFMRSLQSEEEYGE